MEDALSRLFPVDWHWPESSVAGCRWLGWVKLPFFLHVALGIALSSGSNASKSFTPRRAPPPFSPHGIDLRGVTVEYNTEITRTIQVKYLPKIP